ncbi:MAG TPA: alkaline phosphatase family protein [Candidatus Cybelea sp.]|nr:alkaline phosphatase family protein [Candidatus Cybelea sp.]
MKINRRDLLKSAAFVSGAALAGASWPVSNKLFAQDGLLPLPDLPSPANCGIEHIVVLTMENRSFDHFLGWLPNADGQQAGLHYVDNAGLSHSTYSLSGDNTGCPHPDPDHSYDGARVEYDQGKMDGFLRASTNDVYCVGYYGEQDIPFYAALARNYTTCDRYFASILGPTFPNRLFLHAAQTDRLSNTTTISSLPTIWDRLAAAGVRANYFYSNVPFLALWGTKYLGISLPYAEFLLAAAAGTLPAVSFVDPRYTVLDDGTGNDDHPHADIREGDLFLYQTFEAVAQGPKWANTVFIVNFDEWGGFFEHVPPPRATAPNLVDPDLVNGKALLGCRVPTVVASPFSRGNPSDSRVSASVFDHTSVLKLIEWRWGLASLTARDASSDVTNLAYALNFQDPDSAVPNLPPPEAPLIAAPCLGNLGGGILSTGSTTTPTSEWQTLSNQAAALGFAVN